MIVEGKVIAQSILDKLKIDISGLVNKPRLTVFTCAPNFETQKFLALKKKRAEEVGIRVQVIEIPAHANTDDVVQAVTASIPDTDGIVVQLPFPSAIEIARVLAVVPKTHDVDALSYEGEVTNILPPVTGAIDEIANRHQVDWLDKKVAVVGNGRLVGAPAASYACTQGAQVAVLERDTANNDEVIAAADILILGAGVPGLISASMVKDGVLVFDAGTSEEGGMIVGDAAADVGSKAALLTPVPGGIGPITIAVLLRNLYRLSQRSKDTAGQ